MGRRRGDRASLGKNLDAAEVEVAVMILMCTIGDRTILKDPLRKFNSIKLMRQYQAEMTIEQRANDVWTVLVSRQPEAAVSDLY